MKTFYMVHSLNGATDTRHYTFEDAMEEARRLVEKHDKIVFTVLESMVTLGSKPEQSPMPCMENPPPPPPKNNVIGDGIVKGAGEIKNRDDFMKLVKQLAEESRKQPQWIQEYFSEYTGKKPPPTIDQIMTDDINIILADLRHVDDSKYAMVKTHLDLAKSWIDGTNWHAKDVHVKQTQQAFDEAKPSLVWRTCNLPGHKHVEAASNRSPDGSRYIEYRVSKSDQVGYKAVLSYEPESHWTKREYFDSIDGAKEYAEQLDRQLHLDAEKDFDDSAGDGIEDTPSDGIDYITKEAMEASLDEVAKRPKANIYDILLGLNCVKSKLYDEMPRHNKVQINCVLEYLNRLNREGFVLCDED